MFRVLGSLILVSLLMAGSITTSAAPGSQFRVASADLQPILDQASRSGPLAWIEGEISEVGPGWWGLDDGRGRRCYPWTERCPIFLNGRLSCRAAIRPVAPNAYIWARIWCDRNGVPAAIEASYYGGELLVLDATATGITGLAMETGETLSLAVRQDCLREKLAPGTDVYVLLDLEGRIRRAFVL